MPRVFKLRCMYVRSFWDTPFTLDIIFEKQVEGQNALAEGPIGPIYTQNWSAI